MKNKAKKKVKVVYVDDGRTLYDMDGVSRQNAFLPQKVTQKSDKDKKKDERVGLDRKETRAAIRAGFAVYGPIFLGVLACFALVALCMYFWLRH